MNWRDHVVSWIVVLAIQYTLLIPVAIWGLQAWTLTIALFLGFMSAKAHSAIEKKWSKP